MSSKLNLTFNQNYFTNFVRKISDLTSISDTLKLKIDDKNIFIYAISGETIMLAFKNYVIKSSDVFTKPESIELPFEIILSNAKKFVKNMSFIKTSEKINLEIVYRLDKDGVPDVRLIQFKNGKLKLNFQNGESSEIKDINMDMLNKRLNPKNKKWSFIIKSDDFQDIKKLSSINSDGKVINISAESGQVKVSESSNWELVVDECESNQVKNIMFNKNYLSSINDSERIEFMVFDTFLLTKDKTSDYDCNLMISFEQDFEED